MATAARDALLAVSVGRQPTAAVGAVRPACAAILFLLTAAWSGMCGAGASEPGGTSLPSPIIPATEVVIAAIGDIMAHAPVQRAADRHPLGWRGLWLDLEPLLRGADITYANLETVMADGILANGQPANAVPVAYDGAVFTGYPQFNAHSRLALSLAESGIDIVSVANNHSLDRGAVGVDLTLAALKAAGVGAVGASARGGGSSGWVTVVHAGGLRFAWIGCTFSTNGIPDPFDQVLRCYEPSARVLDLVRATASDPTVDAVVVTPHFGSEYQTTPDDRQRAFARALVDAGALLVIGTHPHVVQPGEWHSAPDGRTGFILYSLGNFISAQAPLETRSSAVLLVGIGRTVDGGIGVAGVRLLPIFTSTPDAAEDGDVQVLPAAEFPAGQPSHALISARLADAPLIARGDPITTLADDATGRPALAQGGAFYEGPVLAPVGNGFLDEGGAWPPLADAAAEGAWQPAWVRPPTDEEASLLVYAVDPPKAPSSRIASRQPEGEGGADFGTDATVSGDHPSSAGIAP